MFNLDALLLFMFYYCVSIFIENIYTSEDGCDNENEVSAGQTNEDAVDGALHLRPGENDDGDEVPEEAEDTNEVEENTGDSKVKQGVECHAG